MIQFGTVRSASSGLSWIRLVLLMSFAALAAALSAQQPAPEARVFLERARLAIELNPRLEYSPTTLLVRFAPGADESARRAVRAMVGGPSIQKYSLVPGLELIGTQMEPGLASRLLHGQRGVLYAGPDYIVHANVIPNDPSFSSLWGLHNTGQNSGLADADIDAPEAWDISTGDPNFVIADIDTGVQLNHTDLAANIWVNPGEIAGNGIDDDKNGYIDDVNGWDFYNNDNNPSDDHGHGTHTSGTIGAVGNNGTGVTGVNWRCKIMALKFLGANGSGPTSAAISCLNYAVRKGVKISNNSWGGGGFEQALYDAIDAAKSANHLFIAAAGNGGADQVGDNNDSIPHYPSSYNLDNIISVASTTRTDTRSSFSNYGLTSVDLGAPGSSILSTVPTNSLAQLSGTSMATPHVAGVAALVYAAHPTWTYQQVRTAILSTVRPISALSGITVTGGVVNALGAMQYGAPVNQAPTVTINSPSNNSVFTVGTSVNFAGTANDPEQGGISGLLQWTSSINGAIGNGSSFSTSGLSVGTHTITAQATDNGGLTGSASITVTIQAQQTVPAAPSNLVISRSGSSALLSWTDNSSNESGFVIERQPRLGGNNWGATTTITLGPNVTSYSDTPGRGFFRYRVQSFNSAGGSAFTAYVQIKL